MELDENDLVGAIESISRALVSLGNGNACTQMGAIEAHGKAITDAGSKIADAINGLADAIVEIASIIEKQG